MKNSFVKRKLGAPKQLIESKTSKKDKHVGLRQENVYVEQQVTDTFKWKLESIEDEEYDDENSKVLKETLDLISKGQQILSEHEDESAVLVIGNTGVGKSTLVNYLSGVKLKKVEREVEKYAYGRQETIIEEVLEVDKSVGQVMIGHDSSSMTAVPNKWHDNQTNITYWDCPGFEDTHGPTQDIANAFYIQRLFSIPKIKLLLVVQETSLGENRGDAFLNIIRQFSNLVKDFSRYEDCTSLVVTKASGSLNNVVNKIKKIFYDRHSELKDTELDVLTMLLYGSNQENNKDKKIVSDVSDTSIVLFEYPRDLGEVSGQNRDEILRELGNKKYVEPKEVNIAVSQSSLLHVEDLAKFVNDRIMKSLLSLCKVLKTEFQINTERVYEKVDPSTEDLIYLMQFINAVSSAVSKIVISSEESNSVSAFINHIEEKIISNSDINLGSAGRNAFKDLVKNFEYISFFASIKKDSIDNIRIQEWISQLKQFSALLSSEIHFLKSKMYAKFGNDQDSLDNFIEQLRSVNRDIQNSCKQKKSFLEFKQYLKDFEKLDELIRVDELSFNEIIKYIENTIIDGFKLDGRKLTSVKMADEVNCIINFESTVSDYQKDVKSSLGLFIAELKRIYEKSIEEFIRKDIIQEIEDNVKLLLNKMGDYCIALNSMEDLVRVKSEFMHIIAGIRKEENNLSEVMDKLTELAVRNNLDIHLANKVNALVQALEDVIQIESSFGERKERLWNKFIDELQLFSSNLDAIYSRLSYDIVTEVEQNINLNIDQFINKVTLNAAHNKGQVDQLVSVFTNHLEGIDETQEIPLIIQNIRAMCSDMEIAVTNHLDNILSELNRVVVTDEAERERALRVDRWKIKISSLIQDIQNSDNALVQQELSSNVRCLSDAIDREITDNIPKLDNTFEMRTKLSELHSLFPNSNSLLSVRSVGDLSTILLGNVINYFNEMVLIKDRLEEIRGKSVEVSIDTVQMVANFSTRILLEKKWYELLDNIYSKLSSSEFVFDQSNIVRYGIVNPHKFYELLERFGLDNIDVYCTPRRHEQLQKLIDVTLRDNTKFTFSPNKLLAVGNFVKISNVKEKSYKNQIIEVIAKDTVYFDEAIDSHKGLIVIAPRWYIPENITISLCGINANSYNSKANDGLKYGGIGVSGNNGERGGSAGHFYGVIDHDINNVVKLTINANGGNGGRGQSGGNGGIGYDGLDGGSPERYPGCHDNCIRIKLEKNIGKKWYKYQYTKYGTLGTPGGYGGDAGCGGIGGYPGIIKLYQGISDISHMLNKNAKKGLDGKDGIPGCGGKGGKHGMDRHDVWSQWKESYEGEWLTYKSGNRKTADKDKDYARDGKSGNVKYPDSSPRNTLDIFNAQIEIAKGNLEKEKMKLKANDDIASKVILPRVIEFIDKVNLTGDNIVDDFV